TASLAGRKVLVRTACVLVALCMVAASFWLSVPIIAEWDGPPHESAQKLVLLRAAAAARLAELTAVQAVALAVLACGSVALTVPARAVLEALLARYRRRLLIVGGGILLYGSAFVARQMMPDTADGGFVRALDAVFGATLWIVVTAVALATAWLFRNALRESVL